MVGAAGAAWLPAWQAELGRAIPQLQHHLGQQVGDGVSLVSLGEGKIANAAAVPDPKMSASKAQLSTLSEEARR